MKIVAISDQHGFLPKIPSCDLFLIAGDLCPAINHSLPFQESWLETNFKPWLEAVDAKCKVVIAGNHDFIAEHRKATVEKIFRNSKNVHYLHESSCEFEGLKIYGIPHTLYFYDWAFNLYEADLKKKWAKIPADTDILVSHGPPYGYGDLAPRIITNKNEQEWPAGEHVGSPSLREWISETQPKLVVFGHIHEGRGEWKCGDTTVANVTVVNSKYKNIHTPWTVELEVQNG